MFYCHAGRLVGKGIGSKKGGMEVKEEQKIVKGQSKQEMMNKHAIRGDRESKRWRECDE